jgi:hypothetical protein
MPVRRMMAGTRARRRPVAAELVRELQVERYRYLQQQLHTVNENVYRFLTIYQTLATTLVAGALALWVGYRRWGIDPALARHGVVGILLLVSVVAAFTVLLIFVGILNWLDYRHEECRLTDEIVYPGFRSPPRTRNLLRWYETWVLLFIAVSVAVMWVYALTVVLPAIR